MATPRDRVASIVVTWESGRSESIPLTFAGVSRFADRLRTITAHIARSAGRCINCDAPIEQANPHRAGRMRCPVCHAEHERARHRERRARERAAAPAERRARDDYRCVACGAIYQRERSGGRPSPRCPWCRAERRREIDREWKRAQRAVALDWGQRSRPPVAVAGGEPGVHIGPAVDEIVAASERERADAP